MRVILNFIRDDKYIDNVIRCHDMVSEDCVHIYALVDYLFSHKELKFISQSHRIIRIKAGSVLGYIKKNKIDAVFLHGLFVLPLFVIHGIPSNVKVFWFSWGYDIYGNGYGIDKASLIKKNLYHEKTKEILSLNNKDFIKRVIPVCLYPLYAIKQSIIYHFYKKAVSRVDYYSGVLPIEYHLCSQSPFFKAKEVRYFYLPSQAFFNISFHTSHNRKNVLIGNSADMGNNHLDILPYLEKIRPCYSKVILPFCYGGYDEYNNIVLKEYNDFFGEKLEVLKQFISLNEYIDIMYGCKAAIFLHERQQGIGTILMLLMMGCKVFLSETSVSYQYFYSIGIKVFSVQRELSYDELNTELSTEIQQNNMSRLNVSGIEQLYYHCMDHIYKCIS